MIIRLRIDTGIDTAAHAQTIFDAIKDKNDWFIPISSLEPNSLEIHLCNHDPPCNEPCTMWEHIVNGVVLVHEGNPV